MQLILLHVVVYRIFVLLPRTSCPCPWLLPTNIATRPGMPYRARAPFRSARAIPRFSCFGRRLRCVEKTHLNTHNDSTIQPHCFWVPSFDCQTILCSGLNSQRKIGSQETSHPRALARVVVPTRTFLAAVLPTNVTLEVRPGSVT